MEVNIRIWNLGIENLGLGLGIEVVDWDLGISDCVFGIGIGDWGSGL